MISSTGKKAAAGEVTTLASLPDQEVRSIAHPQRGSKPMRSYTVASV